MARAPKSLFGKIAKYVVAPSLLTIFGFAVPVQAGTQVTQSQDSGAKKTSITMNDVGSGISSVIGAPFRFLGAVVDGAGDAVNGRNPFAKPEAPKQIVNAPTQGIQERDLGEAGRKAPTQVAPVPQSAQVQAPAKKGVPVMPSSLERRAARANGKTLAVPTTKPETTKPVSVVKTKAAKPAPVVEAKKAEIKTTIVKKGDLEITKKVGPNGVTMIAVNVEQTKENQNYITAKKFRALAKAMNLPNGAIAKIIDKYEKIALPVKDLAPEKMAVIYSEKKNGRELSKVYVMSGGKTYQVAFNGDGGFVTHKNSNIAIAQHNAKKPVKEIAHKGVKPSKQVAKNTGASVTTATPSAQSPASNFVDPLASTKGFSFAFKGQQFNFGPGDIQKAKGNDSTPLKVAKTAPSKLTFVPAHEYRAPVVPAAQNTVSPSKANNALTS